jgi:outer membrane immunogenic protein
MNNNFVVGAEGEIWGSGLSGSASRIYGGYYDTDKTRSNFAGDVALRAGYAIDRTLIFGKVGVAMAQYRYSIAETKAGFPAYAYSVAMNATHTGLLLGLGVEYALDMHWSVKGEYDYINYGAKSTEYYWYGSPYPASFKATENILKVGANYRF